MFSVTCLVLSALTVRDTTVYADGTDAIAPLRQSMPYVVKLERESIPVVNKGKVVSYKSSYSGKITVGSPRQQEFRAIFDTGSGHVIVPAVGCEAEACLKRRRYDVTQSSSAKAVNADGTQVDASGEGDIVTIGFGTGRIAGELFEEQVCFGERVATPRRSLRRPHDDRTSNATRPCTLVNTVMATDMSTNPFASFGFDGIVGLGLRALSPNSNSNILDRLTEDRGIVVPQFGLYMSGEAWEAGDVEGGELVVGGHDASARAMSPLVWAPVTMPEQGFWMVEITSISVGGVQLDICNDGDCRGVVDSGASHIGIPAAFHSTVEQTLFTSHAGASVDCRHDAVDAPTLVFALRGLNLTLHPSDYMRKWPLEKANGASSTRLCRPKTTPVKFPAPLGPHLFILGEPVLQAYYTVFDWSATASRIAFAAARPREPSMSTSNVV